MTRSAERDEAASVAARLTLVSVTDPDSGTTNRLYFDDRLIEVVEYSIDPGAGFTRADWDEAREYALSVTSGRLQADLAETYEAASDSPHIAPPTGHS